ncbi:MAG: Ig-like domain-containing protein [Clostridia bacterium]|nr:Ig-like domain-containing protein [Clostridia bacterium]
MNDVVLTYNPYQRKSKILVDGEAFSPYSSITNYLLEPFDFWCCKMCQGISDELNDSFSLTFVSDKFEAAVLKSFVDGNCPDCKSLLHEDFKNNIPVSSRCKILSEALIKHEIHYDKELLLSVFFENACMQESFVNALVMSNDSVSYEREFLAFENYQNLCTVKAELSGDVSAAKTGIFIFDSFKNADAFLRTNSFVGKRSMIIVMAEGFRTIQVKKDLLVLEMTLDELIGYFREIIDYLLIKPTVSKLADQLKSCNYAVYEAVTTVEAVVLADFESVLESGSSTPVRIRTIPEGAFASDIYVKSLNEKVVQAFPDRLVGINSGEATVEVYQVGDIVPILRKSVTVIKRNRINKITFDSNAYILEEEGSVWLNAAVYPENADNVHSLEWISSDSGIATVSQDGQVKAISSGICRIYLKAESVSECVEITVKPKVSELKVPSVYGNCIKATIGQKIPFEVTAVPNNAFDTNVYWNIVQNGDVIKYDGHTISTEHLGKASVEFCSADGKVKAGTDVEVISTLYKKSNPFKAIAVFIIILTLILSFIEIPYGILSGLAAAVFGLLSVFVDNKNKEFEQSIIGNTKTTSLAPSVIICISAIAALIYCISIAV